ncbi:MAG TPA: hypothetical protein VM532_11840 [Burkholderiales bacterium]|jgi:hypothetical protein|nr:hypothetical protein [Burkholderiales bacterium]
MISFIRNLLSRSSKPTNVQAPQSKSEPSPVSVRFDDWGIYTAVHGEAQGKVEWKEIKLIAIRIEDSFLPFPYWYIGNKENLLRIPNDAQGAKDLFFDGFSEKIPGYKCDATFRTIIEASGAMDGSFILWKSADAEA